MGEPGLGLWLECVTVRLTKEDGKGVTVAGGLQGRQEVGRGRKGSFWRLAGQAGGGNGRKVQQQGFSLW